MIAFHGVSKSYANHSALSNIDLNIETGEMVFLTGHSGAGKSTLLKLIMLIEPATKGQVFVNQQSLSRLAKRQIPAHRRQIGMVFQNPRLLLKQNIFDNVALPLIIAGHSSAEIKRRVRAALEKVGLKNKESRYPIELSYGEQQRVGIARAVVNRPAILLADEPTGNLDPDMSTEIIDCFCEFNAVGTTVVIATHDLAMIARLNYPILTLKSGKLTHPYPA